MLRKMLKQPCYLLYMEHLTSYARLPIKEGLLLYSRDETYRVKLIKWDDGS